jgi:hypothetical protein
MKQTPGLFCCRVVPGDRATCGANAARVEADETKREGKPGEATASELNEVIWYALLAREFTRALAAVDHAHELSPDDLEFEINRAHFTPESGHVQRS